MTRDAMQIKHRPGALFLLPVFRHLVDILHDRLLAHTQSDDRRAPYAAAAPLIASIDEVRLIVFQLQTLGVHRLCNINADALADVRRQSVDDRRIAVKYVTLLLTPLTLLVTLASYSTNTSHSLTKSLHSLNLAILTFVNFAASVLMLIPKQPVSLQPPLYIPNLTAVTLYTTVFLSLK